MRIILILLISITVFNSKAMPTDTITVWHLDFNGVKYLDLFPFDNLVEMEISKDTLTKESTFSIHQAAGCFWCDTCTIHFAIYDQNQQLVELVSGVNTLKDLTMYLRQLLAYHERTGERTFSLYYAEGNQPTIETIKHMVRLTLVD